jgi:hypothetical protein
MEQLTLADAPTVRNSGQKTTEEIAAYWAEQVARMEAEAQVAWPNLVAASKAMGDRAQVQTGAGVGLIVNQVSYGHADEADVIARTATPEGIVATQDGRGVVLEWHQDGPSDIDGWVYYERWEHGLRIAHGYVDPTTRKIVQSG